LKSTDKF